MMKKIKISEPCHENWNDFTPTQQGAFCGKCKINVIDFSTKSNFEIKAILSNNEGNKMCGRFSTDQLQSYNLEYDIWKNQNQSTFQSKFIFALILGFGLTLFSCSTKTDTQAINQINTIINIDSIKSIVPLIDSVKTIDSVHQIKPIIDCNTPDDYDIMGEIEEFIPNQEVLGGLDIEVDEKTISETQITKGKISPVKIDTSIHKDLKNQFMIMGKMAPPFMIKDSTSTQK